MRGSCDFFDLGPGEARPQIEKIRMNGLRCVIKPSKNAHPEICALLDDVLKVLNKRFDYLAVRRQSKYHMPVISCRSYIKVIRGFVAEDELIRARILVDKYYEELTENISKGFGRQEEKDAIAHLFDIAFDNLKRIL